MWRSTSSSFVRSPFKRRFFGSFKTSAAEALVRHCANSLRKETLFGGIRVNRGSHARFKSTIASEAFDLPPEMRLKAQSLPQGLVLASGFTIVPTNHFTAKDEVLVEKDKTLAAKDRELAAKDKVLAMQDEQYEKLLADKEKMEKVLAEKDNSYKKLLAGMDDSFKKRLAEMDDSYGKRLAGLDDSYKKRLAGMDDSYGKLLAAKDERFAQMEDSYGMLLASKDKVLAMKELQLLVIKSKTNAILTMRPIVESTTHLAFLDSKESMSSMVAKFIATHILTPEGKLNDEVRELLTRLGFPKPADHITMETEFKNFYDSLCKVDDYRPQVDAYRAGIVCGGSFPLNAMTAVYLHRQQRLGKLPLDIEFVRDGYGLCNSVLSFGRVHIMPT